MNTKIIGISIAAVIGIIVLGSVLMPILDDATETEKKFVNEGRYYVTTEIEDDVSITMNYDIETDVRSWYIDGELLTYADYPSDIEYIRTPTVAGTDNYVFRTDGRTRGINNSTGSTDYSLTVTNEHITSGTKVGNAPLFVASTEQTDNVMRNNPTQPGYVHGDSEIIGCGYTLVSVGPDININAVISFKGSVNDGVEITVFDANYTFTVDNVKVNATPVDGFVDLYDFTSVTFDVVSTNDAVTSCTYSMVVLPAEVTAEKAVHFTNNQNTLLMVIPMLIIVAILIGVVALVVRSKLE